MKHLFLASLCLTSSLVFAERFDGANNPNNFQRIAGSTLTLDFNTLPLSGRLSDTRLAWSETYWPSNKGGIAYRWNHPDPQPFKYKILTKSEVMSMSQEQLSQLSPAELYDLAQGDYSFSLTRKTLSMYSTRDAWWEGICHGWAQAAANYPEPAPVTIINRDGLRVPFGSSDVKGLLAMHDAFNYKGDPYGFIGKFCRIKGKVEGEHDPRDGREIRPTEEQANSSDCKDVNAGSFHVAVTNMIGIFSKSFVADIDRYGDIWNQPVAGYDSRILGEEPLRPQDISSGVARRIRIATSFIYGEELQIYSPQRAAERPDIYYWQSKLPVTGTPNQQFRNKNYEYIVELDAAGKVVGGEWISGTRPDVLWLYARSKKFKATRMNLTGLNAIYRPVQR